MSDMFEKFEMVDSSDDQITVEVSAGEVDVTFTEPGESVLMCLSPKQARRLARALKRAALSIEQARR